MKKFFQAIGMITLVCLSFIYTEKTVNVVKEVDEIMIKIKEENLKYMQAPINATINNNTIIPGINGQKINENASYAKMKRLGSYNPSLLEYQTVYPDISIKNIYDKYVVAGNNKKKIISLIFLVKGNDNVDNILKILEQKSIKANFFVDSTWMEQNNEKLTQIIEKGHVVGNLSYNLNYTHSDFIWMDTIIKKIGKQKTGYCYNEKDNSEYLKICSIHKNYTIRPSIIVKTYPSIETKEGIKNGSIISFPVNNVVERELGTLINFINSKGYQIANLSTLLSEDSSNKNI